MGYDINCGVRLLVSDLRVEAVRDRIAEITRALFRNIPSGVGESRKDLRLDRAEAERMATRGARWAVQRGFGSEDDLRHTEDGGCLEGADFSAVSERAFERGRSQVGTVGSGNHFIEVGYVDEVYDPEAADRMGFAPGTVTVTIHTGSRAFGYQICDDFIRTMQKAAARYGIELPDRQLCCAPFRSEEGQRYFAAMKCAANFAFANRQLITHWVRETFEEVGFTPREHNLTVVYDVCHNIAKVETHVIDGRERKVCVHRKGATRAFPPGHPALPESYRDLGQPVLVPGDMGRYSYVLVGVKEAPDYAFASSCHGAGRLLSRNAALKEAKGRKIAKELADKGITVIAASRATIDEELPQAYKDVAGVVDVVEKAGLAKKVVRIRPLGVLKG